MLFVDAIFFNQILLIASTKSDAKFVILHIASMMFDAKNFTHFFFIFSFLLFLSILVSHIFFHFSHKFFHSSHTFPGANMLLSRVRENSCTIRPYKIAFSFPKYLITPCQQQKKKKPKHFLKNTNAISLFLSNHETQNHFSPSP